MSLAKEKNHRNEGSYECTLTPIIKEIALHELHEDDTIRGQALRQFRDWIEKHPRIKHCRTDSLFLLRFLRCKKYSISNACNMLERYLTVRQAYPEIYLNLDTEDKAILDIIDRGYIFPLPQHDSHGRKLVIRRLGQVDPHNVTTINLLRARLILMEAYIEDETSQVTGFSFLEDFANTTMAHFTLFSFSEIKTQMQIFYVSTSVLMTR